MRTPMKWLTVSTLVLLLAACSAADQAGSEPASDADVGVGDEGSAGFEPGTEGDAEAEAPAASDGDSPFGEGLDVGDPDRDVITTGTITLSTEDPVAAAGRITTMVDRMGGRVEEQSLRAGSDTVDASAHIVLRLPSTEVGTALGRLSDFGRIETTDLERTDVTLQVRDLGARMRALEMSVSRMEALLEQARTREDLVQAEQMLTERQQQLDQLLTQQSYLADQVSMSTLTIDIVVPEEVPPPPPEPEEPATGFLGGLENGWNAFLDFGGVALLVIGALLPWLVFATVVVLVALALRRLWVRWRPERPARPARQARPGPATTLPPGFPGTPGPAGGPAPVAWATPAGPAPAGPAPAAPAPARTDEPGGATAQPPA